MLAGTMPLGCGIVPQTLHSASLQQLRRPAPHLTHAKALRRCATPPRQRQNLLVTRAEGNVNWCVVSAKISMCRVRQQSACLLTNLASLIVMSAHAAGATTAPAKPVITLTDNALKHLQKLRAESGGDELLLRIGVKSGGCSGDVSLECSSPCSRLGVER